MKGWSSLRHKAKTSTWCIRLIGRLLIDPTDTRLLTWMVYTLQFFGTIETNINMSALPQVVSWISASEKKKQQHQTASLVRRMPSHDAFRSTTTRLLIGQWIKQLRLTQISNQSFFGTRLYWQTRWCGSQQSLEETIESIQIEKKMGDRWK